MKKTTIDAAEVAKFAQHASHWWDTQGPLRTLHDINPVRVEFIQKFVSLSKQNIIDIGCGGGILTEELARQGANVTGLDVEPDAIEAAKAHAKETKLKINYICQLIEDFDEATFDIVTCMEMLEHVPDPQHIINHCARLVKPGGYLFLSTLSRTVKAYTNAIVAAEYILKLLPRQTHDFAKFIKPSELAAMIRAAGLEMVGMSGMAYNPITCKASLTQSVDVNYLMAFKKVAIASFT